MATPDHGSSGVAASVARFATLTDCDAEPTGIYFGKRGATTLFVNIQHRGGDGLDKSLAITAESSGRSGARRTAVGAEFGWTADTNAGRQ